MLKSLAISGTTIITSLVKIGAPCLSTVFFLCLWYLFTGPAVLPWYSHNCWLNIKHCPPFLHCQIYNYFKKRKNYLLDMSNPEFHHRLNLLWHTHISILKSLIDKRILLGFEKFLFCKELTPSPLVKKFQLRWIFSTSTAKSSQCTYLKTVRKKEWCWMYELKLLTSNIYVHLVVIPGN